MSRHGAFNAYLFRMKLMLSPERTHCDRRGRDDDAWHTWFDCPVFQLYREDAMTTLQKMGEQPLTPDRLVSIMLKNWDGWDQAPTFITLTMYHKMEIAWKRQRRPTTATTQYPMPDLVIHHPPPRVCH